MGVGPGIKACRAAQSGVCFQGRPRPSASVPHGQLQGGLRRSAQPRAWGRSPGTSPTCTVVSRDVCCPGPGVLAADRVEKPSSLLIRTNLRREISSFTTKPPLPERSSRRAQRRGPCTHAGGGVPVARPGRGRACAHVRVRARECACVSARVCMRASVCVCECVCPCICVCECTSARACASVCASVCLCMCVSASVHACVHKCVCVCEYVYVPTHVCACRSLCLYVFVCTDALPGRSGRGRGTPTGQGGWEGHPQGCPPGQLLRTPTAPRSPRTLLPPSGSELWSPTELVRAWQAQMTTDSGAKIKRPEPATRRARGRRGGPAAPASGLARCCGHPSRAKTSPASSMLHTVPSRPSPRGLHCPGPLLGDAPPPEACSLACALHDPPPRCPHMPRARHAGSQAGHLPRGLSWSPPAPLVCWAGRHGPPRLHPCPGFHRASL